MRPFVGPLLVAAVVVGSEPLAAPCNPVWVTVDDYLGGTDGSSATAVAVDTSAVWVGGMVSDALTGHWVMRKKVGTGPFVTVDDFIYTVGLRNRPTSIVTAGQTVVVVGGSNDTREWGRWLVRRSTNDGASWSITDDFDAASVSSWATSMTALPNGTLLAGGLRYSSAGAPDGYHWITRSSTDLGATWATANDAAPLYASAGPKGMTVDKAGDVYAAGFNFNYTQYRWQTRKRLASTGAWTLVDDWQTVPDSMQLSHGGQPEGVAAGKHAGEVLVAGTAVLADGRVHWVVRKTSNGGATWAIVDDLPDCLARDITFDRKDERGFFVTGRCAVGGRYRWITRVSDQNGNNWTTDDDYALSPAASAIPNAIDYTRGGLYAVGVADDGKQKHWLVRARVCEGTVAPVTVPSTGLRQRDPKR